MSRPWHVWSALLASLLVVSCALTWLTIKAIEVDRAEAEARRQAIVEDNARLALWRMESIAAPIVARENVRPYFAYSPFISDVASSGKSKGFQSDAAVPSPLLAAPPEDVLLYFQFREGRWTSPQAPNGAMLSLAAQYRTTEQLNVAQQQLESVSALIKPNELLARLQLDDSFELAGTPLRPAGPIAQQEQGDPELQVAQQQQVAVQADTSTIDPPVQAAQQMAQRSRNVQEFQARSQYAAQNAAGYGGYGEQALLNALAVPSANVRGGTMLPLWIDGQLYLTRKVLLGETEVLQGCVLNWPLLQQQLRSAIKELLPNATLEPVLESQLAEHERMLAALPIRLHPGPLATSSASELSPIQFALMLAWICLLLAAAAVAALLRGVVALSERRAAFVSAVTHELRTPLTTFRMYAEMLAEGMVPSEENRRHYLQTLKVEADRLMHLVENVLIYARLERGGPTGRLRSVSAMELLEHCHARLEQRCEQAGMMLTVALPDEVAAARVVADAAAVDQVLFNLVDNASKYAASAKDRRLHTEIAADSRHLLLRVRDHGPGLSVQEVRRLFQPFRKSAGEAANSAPGVGLGLALSRRLAREMGGELSYETCPEGGACFLLKLKRSAS